MSKKLIELTGVGADHVFEAVGKRELQSDAIDYCCSGGTVTFVGLDSEDATINLKTTAITRAEKELHILAEKQGETLNHHYQLIQKLCQV